MGLLTEDQHSWACFNNWWFLKQGGGWEESWDPHLSSQLPLPKSCRQFCPEEAA